MGGSRLDQRATRLVTVVWLAPYLIERTFLLMMCREAEEKIATATRFALCERDWICPWCTISR